ncbi:hypothetical protein [Nocardioides sp. LS1]|uniref:hypothetical protein n=1 Tax=Nocardioides sp. LS1 TaxID=1027620 RepID=UPI000F61D3EE|nr:hypothetical protein [Nocardioides sp. LS1]GCD88640.1 hypothetical protein NLS1_06460 [Nocardioides sp. LS1]
MSEIAPAVPAHTIDTGRGSTPCGGRVWTASLVGGQEDAITDIALDLAARFAQEDLNRSMAQAR